MNTPTYQIVNNPEKLVFIFYSVSDEKIIKKEIAYTPLDESKIIYNLAFGDYSEEGDISDLSISNNQDLEKVLATLVKSMEEFFSIRPNCLIYFTGSTETRTRLYRIVISNYMKDYDELFVIYGMLDDNFEIFKPDKNYNAFLISLKR